MAIDISKLKEKIQEVANETIEMKVLELNDVRSVYQKWYGIYHHILSIYHPERIEEVEKLHSSNCKYYIDIRQKVYSAYRSPNTKLFYNNLDQMKGIVLAIIDIIDFRALEIAALITGDLIDDELEEAKIMLANGYIRCAGAIAGVSLEAHLKLLHNQAKLEYDDREGIVNLATRLRLNDVIELGDEKKCIAMADTRNNCDHKREKDPKIEEVQELIEDVGRFSKRVQVI